jgi:hypothetical protein
MERTQFKVAVHEIRKTEVATHGEDTRSQIMGRPSQRLHFKERTSRRLQYMEKKQRLHLMKRTQGRRSWSGHHRGCN